MYLFAWRNLFSRPIRSGLALLGLSIPVLSVIGLLSLSNGLRSLVGDTVKLVQGIMVLRTNTPSPVFSDINPEFVQQIRKLSGVKNVAPEFWRLAPPVENTSVVLRSLSAGSQEKRLANFLDAPVVLGMDIQEHNRLDSAVYQRAIIKPESQGGRFLNLDDRGKNRLVLSRKFASQYPNPDGTPKKPGDSIRVGSEDFQIVGIYETKSLLLDVVLVMDIDTARNLLKAPSDSVSAVYVEMQDPSDNERVTQIIEEKFPELDSRGMGAIGIANTMIMSTLERVPEFGVLRTNGWSSRQILKLVTLESFYLGILAGISGGLMAIVGCWVANLYLSDGVRLVPNVSILVKGLVLSIMTGALSGMYPAWRASRWSPMEAIRYDP
jgi:putative ABC transport system permease protein